MPKSPTTVSPSHVPAPGASGPNGGPPKVKPRVKKLRLTLILAGLLVLAGVSTVFGMMMAVASDLPALENNAEFRRAQNSQVFPEGKDKPALATLTGNQNRILLKQDDISPNIKNAVISIEDRRFYDHEGVDYQGIGRALFQDLRQQRAAQGGSTITQQFVKNALTAQGNRSVFQKLRESALAYHLERKWTKQKVLTQYLNSVYFGNGAYGVEAAVRTYFRGDEQANAAATPTGLDPAATENEEDAAKRREARDVTPAEAAFLAGIISSPSLYDPVDNVRRSTQRRNLVLDRMLEQELITEAEHAEAINDALPTESDIDPPQPDSDQPYFTSWLTQQLVDRYKAPAVFSGGLKVTTTLDPELQSAAEQAITGRLAGVGPSASLVAIENKTGEVKAMVGGTDFEKKPFNLATNGHRQPGSAFKPFILVRALQDGVSPEATFASQKKFLPVPGSKTDKFVVNNYEGSYSGIASLRAATSRSDNSVFAELGIKVGTKRVAALAQEMGVRTEVSTNPAMTLGGLKEGVTPLEMAFAYSTIANRGVRVSGSLAASEGGPVAIKEVDGGGNDDENEPKRERVFPPGVADTAQELLAGVVLGGTGKAAQIGEFAAGKTGTTENYGDAWFVGFNKELTVAVWVGYPDAVKYMETEYRGGPVAGGTYPTEIWHDFMRSWIGVRERREDESGKNDDDNKDEDVPYQPAQPVAPEGDSTTPARPEAGQEAPKEQRQPSAPPQKTPAPKPAPTPAPVPTPTPTPAPGGQGGGAAPG